MLQTYKIISLNYFYLTLQLLQVIFLILIAFVRDLTIINFINRYGWSLNCCYYYYYYASTRNLEDRLSTMTSAYHIIIILFCLFCFNSQTFLIIFLII